MRIMLDILLYLSLRNPPWDVHMWAGFVLVLWRAYTLAASCSSDCYGLGCAGLGVFDC